MDLSSVKKTFPGKLLAAALLATTATAAVGPAHADGGAPGQAVQVGAQNRWIVMAGASLKDTLEGWSMVSGWTIIWDSPIDYRMRASAAFSGGFEESASRLIDTIYLDNPELSAKFHRGNKVLHIQNAPLTSN